MTLFESLFESIRSSYPSYYPHLMDKYWARQVTYESTAQHEYFNTEKYGLLDCMKVCNMEDMTMTEVEMLKTEYFGSPRASRLQRKLPESFNR